MDLLSISPYWLAVVFFLVAFIYSSVGLGGGSSYTALMAIFGFNPLAIPLLSLVLNLAVSLGRWGRRTGPWGHQPQLEHLLGCGNHHG